MWRRIKEGCLGKIWIQPFFWTFCFTIWYQLYCTAFIGLVLSCSWYLTLIIFVPFSAFWLLSVTSLYKCLYTRPPLIPEQYSVPPKMIKLLSKRDQREFGPDVDLSTDPLSHSSGASTNSDSDSGSNYKSNQEKQKDSQWETFYRQLTDLAINKRKLNVRTTPMQFRGEVVQCPLICTRCMIVKPERVHHCRRCKKCILRMDHHCPALGKCVHAANHKFFILFLMYATVLCLYAFFTTLPILTYVFFDFYSAKSSRSPQSDVFTIPFTFAAMGCLQSLIFPIILIWFQWGLWQDLFHNRTTLEDMKFESDGLPDRSGKYDTGSQWRNMTMVFGEKKYEWLLPVQTTTIEI